MSNNSIRDEKAYTAGIWPDKLFKGLLPRGITPTNIDALYEIGNHFLVFERKPHGMSLLPSPGYGQIGALANYADAAGASSVFVQVCMTKPNETDPGSGDLPTSLLIHRVHTRAIPTTLEAVQALIQAWGQHADACKRGRTCLDLAWLPDAVRCAAAAGEVHGGP